VARRERGGIGPFVGAGFGGEAEVDRRRRAPALGGGIDDCVPPLLRPARRGGGRESRARGQRPLFLLRARKDRVDEAARPAVDERQRGRNDGVTGGFEQEQLREREAEHCPRFDVVRQRLGGRAVDQRVDVGHPAQRFRHDGDGKGAVGTGKPLCGGVHRDVERVAAAQNRVDQPQRGAARREAGRIGGGARPAAPVGTAISHGGPGHGWRNASMIL
jgi:hypothetical protein